MKMLQNNKREMLLLLQQMFVRYKRTCVVPPVYSCLLAFFKYGKK
jgi:hypothetical protein